MLSHRSLFAAVLLGSAVFAGCGNPYYHQPGYGAYNSAYVPPPPAAYGESPGYAPGPGYVWVDGYWDWTGAQWAWTRGYWAVPPRPYARWQRPRYERYGRGYRYHRGYWR